MRKAVDDVFVIEVKMCVARGSMFVTPNDMCFLRYDDKSKQVRCTFMPYQHDHAEYNLPGITSQFATQNPGFATHNPGFATQKPRFAMHCCICVAKDLCSIRAPKQCYTASVEMACRNCYTIINVQ